MNYEIPTPFPFYERNSMGGGEFFVVSFFRVFIFFFLQNAPLDVKAV